MDKKTVERIVSYIEKNYPWEETQLGSMPKDPFRVLVSTVLSQRTRDENTHRATEALFSKYDSAEKILEAKTRDLEKLVKPAGFYRVKAARLKEISKALLKNFGGKVPAEVEKLLSLPGVGRKTANCVLVYGFGTPAVPVDTHVHRISNRLGLVKTKTPEETEKRLIKVVPKKYWGKLNGAMVRFGQQHCLPVYPRCGTCGILELCVFGRKKIKEKKHKKVS